MLHCHDVRPVFFVIHVPFHCCYFILCSFYRLTRIKVEESALVKNMLLFQNRESHLVDIAEFASNLNVTVEDSSLVSLFKMHLEVYNYYKNRLIRAKMFY